MTIALQGTHESGKMRTMTKRKAYPVALVALTAALVCACGVVGCDRGDKAQVDPSSPESYMKDPAFRKNLDDHVKRRNALMSECNRLRVQLDEAKKSGDEAKAKEIEKRLEACKAEYEADRSKMLREVRDRIAPKGRNLKEGR